MKVSDYVMDFISKIGVKHVFYLPGGGAMHLNDSLGQNESLIPVCMLHEQSCAIAAEAYARITEGYSACVVTSGPGGTNAVTGLAGAYLDSTPVFFISGQVKCADLVNGQGIRQFGIQEVDIISIVKPLTKYAIQIKDVHQIRYELEKAAFFACEGRPGPVWIDIPLDVQAMQISPDLLPRYSIKETDSPCIEADIEQTIQWMIQAKRPVLLLGHGVRLSGGAHIMRSLCDTLKIPVLLTWNGVDLLEEDYPYYFGRPGAVGQRHANFIQQNADFVLSIGTRLSLLSTGYDYGSFLKKAVHVMVDIDVNEMKKVSVHPALAIESDAKIFMEKLLKHAGEFHMETKDWLEQCRNWKKKFPILIPDQRPQSGYINTYHLVDEISRQMTGKDIYQFTSSGTTADIAMQVFRIKKGQRAFLTKGLAAMGYDLPACIGSCIASGKKRVVCITGDGGFMMNIQELEVLRRLQLPIKIFIADNNGYGMIYNSQNGNFQGRLTGCTEESGLTIPDISKIANAFNIQTYVIEIEHDLSEQIATVLKLDGPVVCIVKVDIAQKILPRQTNYMREDGQMVSRPLEDMTPLLDRAEYERNLL